MNYETNRNAWLNSPLVSEQDKETIRNRSKENLEDSFRKELSFGTSGLREKRGPGPNRRNLLTIRKAAAGVADYLLGQYGDLVRTQGRVVSFDNRHNSIPFRDRAIKVLSEKGIKVYSFRDPHPTPEVSYAIRKLFLAGGIRITASHNPKEYNGFKFYDKDGVEAAFDVNKGVERTLASRTDELSLTYPLYPTQGEVVFLDDNSKFDDEFLAKERTTSLYKDFFIGKKKTKIVFSSENGCTSKLAPLLLKRLGYEVKTTPTQDYFDPDFAGTENPNPETAASFTKSIEYRKELNQQGEKFNLILNTDPDGDRAGIAFVNSHNEIQRLTGNQYGARLIDFLIGTRKRQKLLPRNGVVVDTFVTSSQGQRIAKSYNVKTRTTATGFKYIGGLIRKRHEQEESFLFGYEESNGALLSTFVRDKDSLETLIALADRNEYYLRRGKTLDIVYEELSARTGTYDNEDFFLIFEGEKGRQLRREKRNSLRSHPFKQIDGLEVYQVEDYLARVVYHPSSDNFTPREENDIDKTDCLKFFFKPAGYLAIRPSGTEPKRKIYTEFVDVQKNQIKEKKERILKELKDIRNLE